MRYLTFSQPEQDPYGICFLVPELHSADIQRIYISPHLAGWEEHLIAYRLVKTGKRTPADTQRAFLGELLPILKEMGTRYLVVCDAEYFRTMTKTSGESRLGYVLPGEGDYEGFFILYCPNFRTMFYNPEKVKADITQALYALKTHIEGNYTPPGLDIIHFAAYPFTVSNIRSWLVKLLEEHTDLTADIESFSLKHYDAGIGTISFAWSKHEGIAFPVDLLESPEDRQTVRLYLKEFFLEFARRAEVDGRRMRWHNIAYDVMVLIYQLFMAHLLDTKGLLEGLGVMLKSWDCTRLITYLATNSCAGNNLGLKDQSQEFAGKYAVDVTDIRSVPLMDLLRYNLIDSLATWFVYEKHWDTLVADQQLEVYEDLFKPSTVDIIQMQLTGLPIDMDEVHRLKKQLEDYSGDALDRMNSNPWITRFVDWQTEYAWKKDFEDRRAKAKNPGKIQPKDQTKFPTQPFNPNSPLQLQRILYDEDFMALPVLDLTDTKAPATGGDTLEKLKNHTTNDEVLEFLSALIDFKTVDKLLTAFIPAFLEAQKGPDEWHYLFGNFNLGGTKSGRLSSSNPNLQNLPSKDDDDAEIPWAMLVKKCFKAPPGWIFCGLDFNSLEDMISALTTKDPNKIKVYTDGFDGHCLRAYGYFDDQMTGIDPESVASINSIKKLYPGLRQESKTPTFLLTYGGTWRGIMDQLGWNQGKAKSVEAKYHELYRVSDEWVAARIAEAGQKGYVEVAFGLRLRTPLLAQTIRGTSKTPYEAEAEARTAGNALGQSWCLLNNRASVEFLGKVRSSEYSLDIRPCAHIHDAQYFLIRDELPILVYVNTHLVKAVRWQDHPLIAHDQVKIGGDLSIFYPSWAEEMVVPNEASQEQIKMLASEHWNKYCK